MRCWLTLSGLAAILLSAFPAEAGNCPEVKAIKTMLFRGAYGVDAAYDRLRSDPSCEPILIAELTDTTAMTDPRQAPVWPNFTVADAAFFVLWSRYDWGAAQFLPPDVATKFEQQGVYAYFGYVADPAHRAALAVRAKALIDQEQHAMPIHLRILLDGRVQLDNGPILDLEQLRIEVRRLKGQDQHPDVVIKPPFAGNYEVLAKILTIFQDEHYGSRIGFTGLQQSDQ